MMNGICFLGKLVCSTSKILHPILKKLPSRELTYTLGSLENHRLKHTMGWGYVIVPRRVGYLYFKGVLVGSSQLETGFLTMVS